MSFYRKYRPQTLTELVGQEHIQRTFLNAIKRQALSHAYLFAGPRGTGKTSTARIIARAINCENPADDGEPCNACTLCTDALKNRLVDLIEIDAASNRGIDEIRELKEKIQFAPSTARAKVYIIDEVHMLTKEAFNALLKTLEEPPAHAYFILATTEAHKVPETIISRCQRFDFHRINEPELVAHLAEIAQREGIAAEPEALALIARAAAGGLRDALSLLEQLGGGGTLQTATVAENLGLARPALVGDFVACLLAADAATALTMLESIVAEGGNLLQFNKAILAELREKMLAQVQAGHLPEARALLPLVASFTAAGEALKTALIPQLPLEIAVVEAVAALAGVQPAVPAAAAKPLAPPVAKAPAAPAKQPTPSAASTPKPAPAPKAASAIPAPTPAAAKKAAEEPTPAVSTGSGEVLTVAAVAAALPAALPKLPKAALRMALREATVVGVSGSNITLGVGSDLLLDKLGSAEGRGATAEALGAVLGQSVSVAVERTELAVAAPTPQPAAKPNLAKAAEDLFADGAEW